MAASTKTWVNNQAPSCEDDDLNGFKNENNNLITSSGQSLSTSDNQQTNKAVATYAAVGEFFNGGGIADAYTLTAPSPRVAPPSLIDGMKFRAIFDDSNTGACTVNPFGLGAVNIKLKGGVTDPSASQIVADEETTFIYRTSPSAHAELVLSSDGGLGVGQTWQDVSASRSVGITYTNTTGKPIMVSIAKQFLTEGLITVDGVLVARKKDVSSQYSFLAAIIPDGSSYIFSGSGTSSIPLLWAELR